MATALRLKRSEKTYFCGLRTTLRKLNEEAKELDWLDKNIELIRQGRNGELKRLCMIDR